VLILPDPSTRLTAFRTGKIDQMGGTPALVKDDFDGLMATNPKTQFVKYLSNGTQLIYMRTDKQDLPFKDVRVRQALTMAIDYKSIVDKLLAGDGEYPGFPTMSGPEFKSIYFPLSEASQIVQDMFSYNPNKAKQLLADAGYPNGFSTNITVDATGGIYTDQMAVIKDYWSKIGVDVAMKPLDNAAFVKEYAARANEQLIFNSSGGYSIYIRMVNYEGGTWGNGSYIDDPKAKKSAAEMQTAMAAGDQKKADAIYKDFEKYAMEQAWMIPFPRAYNYTIWQPWLKNFNGELSAGYSGGFTFAKFVWIDQDLKKSMGAQ
jgi:peptide/nickel transport system substrate-binding protein